MYFLLLQKREFSQKKQLSIPHLELQAAVIATIMNDKMLETHRNTLSKVYTLSDFSTVLDWLCSGKKWPIIVANSVSIILDTTTTNTPRHVQGEMNATDLNIRIPCYTGQLG